MQSGAAKHHVCGWEVADAAALGAVAGRHDAAKTPVERLPAAPLRLRAALNRYPTRT